jgi:hypothetical protein
VIALYLLAAHLVGDFVFQTRWQAAGKLADWRLRFRHVLVYSLCFVPIAAVYASSAWRGAAFGCLLFVLHYLTDSRRFPSTLGDWVGWRLSYGRGPVAGTLKDPGDAERPIYVRLPPNPWTPMPLLIDQTLHVCQVALLGGIFLS